MKSPQFWLKRGVLARLLLPLSWLYAFFADRDRVKKIQIQKKLPKPVIIVGNINVGGTGKTPVTIALIKALQKKDYRVGVISRGYGRLSNGIVVSLGEKTVAQLGDEPYLIQQKTKVPVAVGTNRYEAGLALLDIDPNLDVIVSDDGLQHYALYRDFEIAIFGEQAVGNGYIMPSGPLREKITRLQTVNAIMTENYFSELENFKDKVYPITQSHGKPYVLTNPKESKSLAEFSTLNVSAVAGIAHPDNFFRSLTECGIKLNAYPFSDHHQFTQNDFNGVKEPILMTEKDAVKCAEFLKNKEVWVVPLQTQISSEFVDQIIKHILKANQSSVFIKEA